MPPAKSQTLSFGLHLAMVVFLVLMTSHSFVSPRLPVVHNRVIMLDPPRRLMLANRSEQHAGGSNQTLLPARHGEPPPTSHRTFIPPQTVRDPQLPMPMTVAFDSPTIAINVDQVGDPYSKLVDGAFGGHGHNGIGDTGCCGGIGNKKGGTPGIDAGGGRNFTPAQLIYKVEPEFSEEARKAKYQGMVVMTIEVDPSGRPSGFHVVRPLGLGLDEKAIEAVSHWRFKPGLRDGKPVLTSATVEVTFHLL